MEKAKGMKWDIKVEKCISVNGREEHEVNMVMMTDEIHVYE